MCGTCESAFVTMTKGFTETFAAYMNAYKAGQMCDTSAMRVHDQAHILLEACDIHGSDTVAWYLAIALERLVALECAGIPT